MKRDKVFKQFVTRYLLYPPSISSLVMPYSPGSFLKHKLFV